MLVTSEYPGRSGLRSLLELSHHPVQPGQVLQLQPARQHPHVEPVAGVVGLLLPDPATG